MLMNVEEAERIANRLVFYHEASEAYWRLVRFWREQGRFPQKTELLTAMGLKKHWTVNIILKKLEELVLVKHDPRSGEVIILHIDRLFEPALKEVPKLALHPIRLVHTEEQGSQAA